MYILKILVEHTVLKLNREFLYSCEKEVEIGVRVFINFNKQEIIGFVINCFKIDEPIESYSKKLGFDIKPIKQILDEKPIVNKELWSLAQQLSDHYFYPLIGVLQTMLPNSMKPKHVALNAPKIKYDQFYIINKEKLNTSILSKNAAKLVLKFENTPILEKNKLSKSKTLDDLIERKIIEIKTVEANRYVPKLTFNYEKEITLTEEQNFAFEEILKDDEYSTYLLKGVTGSGKTEVYIKLIEQVKLKNKGAIILVPEIALTPLMISRLLSYFNEGVAVLHSSLTPAQRYDEYRRISKGEATIVVGTRSAIFAPVKGLGLIIIDEENDESYKEDDQRFLYNARDVALMRIKMNNAKLVLGSATPSVETMAKARKGLIKLIELKNRYYDVDLPNVMVVNRNDRNLFSLKSNIFSLPLIQKIKEVVSRGDQVILLINSRGYSNNLQCRECGEVFKCPTCNLPLHYHRTDNILYCHHCEYKIKKPNRCPKCNSEHFKFGNFGIERVEEDFKKLFNIPYLILDSDRANKTYQIENILKEFNDNKYQVLIGTQMVSKGHDFKNVSLVGVLNADTLLNFPNYRSNEMTFSLLTQTIGRAGRFEKTGEAIIQTSYVDNFVIQSSTKQDYEEFYSREIKLRKMCDYPPFLNLLSFSIRSKKYENTQKYSDSIKKYFDSLNLKDVQILGPSKITEVKPFFINNIFVKYKKLNDLKEKIELLIESYKNQNDVELKINLNPYSY
ncbi:MAG: primosomal protein N' [Bacilli bacterium]|nr:primosomal protein N' [Bacilli bacterium]